LWLGLAFSVACLVVFARNARWAEIRQALAAADVRLLFLGALCLLATSPIRALRWRYLLKDAPVSFRHRLTSTLIGFAANNALPGRLGEPLRCFVVSRLDRRVGFWQAAGSIVVERAFDLAAAAVLLVIFVYLAPFPPDAAVRQTALFRHLQDYVVPLAFGLTLALAALAAFARSRISEHAGWLAPIVRPLRLVQKGFAGLGSLATIVPAALLTALLWFVMLVFELLMLRAFGFSTLGFRHAVGIIVVLSFAIALPQAPGGFGVVQLATETTLTALYGMPTADAKAYAIGFWTCQVSVVIGAGIVALWYEGLSLADIRRARGTIGALRKSTSPE
jgi:uncharacterized membrane protein YbhN (UPF0104 family)